jgi:hypothetical protein
VKLTDLFLKSGVRRQFIEITGSADRKFTCILFQSGDIQ